MRRGWCWVVLLVVVGVQEGALRHMVRVVVVTVMTKPCCVTCAAGRFGSCMHLVPGWISR